MMIDVTTVSRLWSLLRVTWKKHKYAREVCDYLGIDRDTFYTLAQRATELHGSDFYNKKEANGYIAHLVWYNRILHDRDQTWVQLVQLLRKFCWPEVLEYGCGTGCLTQYLQEMGPPFVSFAYDIPSQTLGFAKWRLKDTQFLDRIDGSRAFDIVVCLSVLEHIPLKECWDTLRLLANISRRVLVVNFVTGPRMGHLPETQAEFPKMERYLDERFAVKSMLWAPDLFAYER